MFQFYSNISVLWWKWQLIVNHTQWSTFFYHFNISMKVRNIIYHFYSTTLQNWRKMCYKNAAVSFVAFTFLFLFPQRWSIIIHLFPTTISHMFCMNMRFKNNDFVRECNVCLLCTQGMHHHGIIGEHCYDYNCDGNSD